MKLINIVIKKQSEEILPLKLFLEKNNIKYKNIVGEDSIPKCYTNSPYSVWIVYKYRNKKHPKTLIASCFCDNEETAIILSMAFSDCIICD